MHGWYFLASAYSAGPAGSIRPWQTPFTLNGNGFAVLGDGTPPAELPGAVPYFQLNASTGDIPFTSLAFALGLFDDHGRLIDFVRSQREGFGVTHHTTRMPIPYSDFVGAAPRTASDDGVVARVTTVSDTNSGIDWRASTIRTMGSLNGAGITPDLGHAQPIDARFELTHIGQIMVVINAGPTFAGVGHGYLLSGGHNLNVGPFYGMGNDALDNLMSFGTLPPHMGILDSRGSTRMDFPVNLPVGLVFDLKFFTFNPITGALLAQTLVMEIDT
jgi:hypothetical protein